MDTVKNMLNRTGSMPFFIVSFILVLTAQFNMYNGKPGLLAGLVLFAVSAVFFVLAQAARPLPQPYAERPAVSMAAESIMFMAVMAVSIFFRTYRITELPGGLYFDEAALAEAASSILKDGTIYGVKYPVYVQADIMHSSYLMYMISAFFKFFGAGIMQERAVLVTCGILGAAAFYFFARSMFGVRVAFFAGLLFGCMRWPVTFGRIGFYTIFGVLLGIFSMYAAWSAYKNRKTADFIMLGISAGLLPYGYIPARMLLVALPVFFIYLFFKDRSFYKQNMKKIFISAAAFLLVVAPVGIHILTHLSDFLYRNNQVSILNPEVTQRWFSGRFTVAQAVMDTFQRTFLMFNYRGDMNPRHNFPGYPMVDFFTGILFVMGFLYSLTRMLKPKYFFLLVLFFMTLAPGLFTIEAPQGNRVIFAAPVIIMFASVTISKFFEYFGSAENKGKKALLYVPVIILVVLAAAENYNVYFNRQAVDRQSFDAFNGTETSIANFLLKKGDTYQGVLEARLNGRPFNYVMSLAKKNNFEVYREGGSAPILNPISGKNYIYFLPVGQEIITDQLLKKVYPRGTKGMVMDSITNRNIMAYYYEVSAAEMAEVASKPVLHGLKADYYTDSLWEKGPSPFPAVSHVEPFIYFNWHLTPILGKFSARWTGKIEAQKSGNYIFSTTSNDETYLKIDGKQILENRNHGGQIQLSSQVYLSKGRHSIELLYSNDIGQPSMILSWQTPWTTSLEPVPYDVLSPK